MRAEPKFSSGKSILFSVIIIGAILGIGEFGARIVLSRYAETGTFTDRAIENPFHPYLGWVAAPNYKVNTTKDGPKTTILTDSDGNSITPTVERPVLTVAVTGGSTMFGVGASGNDGTVPTQLQAVLTERLGVPVKIINLGVRGYNSFQEMLRLREWLSDHKVDMVLSVSGRNDAYAARLATKIDYMMMPAHIWANAVPLIRAAEVEKPILLNPAGFIRQYSALADVIVRISLRAAAKLTPEGPAAPRPETPPIDQAVTAPITAQHYRMMETLSRAANADYLMVLQPTAYTLDRLPEKIPSLAADIEKERKIGKLENAYFDLLRREMTGVSFADLSASLNGTPGEALYIDPCHYTDEGGRLLSAALADLVVPRLRLRLDSRKD